MAVTISTLTAIAELSGVRTRPLRHGAVPPAGRSGDLVFMTGRPGQAGRILATGGTIVLLAVGALLVGHSGGSVSTDTARLTPMSVRVTAPGNMGGRHTTSGYPRAVWRAQKSVRGRRRSDYRRSSRPRRSRLRAPARIPYSPMLPSWHAYSKIGPSVRRNGIMTV